MPADTADISGDGCVLLRPAAFPQDEAGFHVGDVLLADLFDGKRLPVFFPFFGGVVTMSDAAKLRFRFTTSGLWGPYAMEAYRIAT